MRQIAVLALGLALFACGGDQKPVEADEKPSNPVTEKADALHDSIDRAHEVETLVQDQKTAIDAALEEAEDSDPD